jgi:hypothetical protein
MVPKDEPTTVLYITGAGRSGSTLLERILGACPGFVNVGELIALFRWVVPQDERCGCGQPFSACLFWQRVGDRAFGGWTDGTVESISQLQRCVARQRRVPQLLLRHQPGARFDRDLADYQDVYQRLYTAIRDEADARVVVDASKWPAHGLAIAKAPGLDVRILHLVRDVRGVAYSSAKTGVSRPHANASLRRNMATHPVSRSAIRWSAFAAEAEVVRRVASHRTRLRYEDLVADPRGSVTSTLRELGLPVDDALLTHLDADGVTLEASHGIGGNPSRFRVGHQHLRLDEAWRGSMERRQRWAASVLGMPALLGYGYLGRLERQGRGR